MKHVAQLARKRNSRYLHLFEFELEVLDTLPPWMFRLFAALVRCSNWGTGAGSTTYGDLVDMLTPLQPRSGMRHYVPDAWAIRRALIRFEDDGLLKRQTGYSQQGEALFFDLEPRKAKVRATS